MNTVINSLVEAFKRLKDRFFTPDPSVDTPPCSKWLIWTGGEVEGTQDRDVFTLFIRGFSEDVTAYSVSIAAKAAGVERIWFCKEFRNWDVVREFCYRFKTVCIELELGQALPPGDMLYFPNLRIYYKVPSPGLRPGDQLCFGRPFHDEAFEIGKGISVTPDNYKEDVRLL
jgi:hypothetical protein